MFCRRGQDIKRVAVQSVDRWRSHESSVSVVGSPRPKKVCARISNTSLFVVTIDMNFCHFLHNKTHLERVPAGSGCLFPLTVRIIHDKKEHDKSRPHNSFVYVFDSKMLFRRITHRVWWQMLLDLWMRNMKTERKRGLGSLKYLPNYSNIFLKCHVNLLGQ